MKSEFLMQQPSLKTAVFLAISNLHNKYAGGL